MTLLVGYAVIVCLVQMALEWYLMNRTLGIGQFALYVAFIGVTTWVDAAFYVLQWAGPLDFMVIFAHLMSLYAVMLIFRAVDQVRALQGLLS